MSTKETAIINAQKHTMSTHTSCPICTKALKNGRLSHYFSFTVFSILKHFTIYLVSLEKVPLLELKLETAQTAGTGNQTAPNHPIQMHQNFCAKCYQVTIFTMYSNYEKL